MRLKDKIYEYRFAILIAFLSGIVALFKEMALFFPILMGIYIVYRFHKQAKEIRVATVFYPFLLFVTCLTSGFGFLIILLITETLKTPNIMMNNVGVWILLGLCGAVATLLVTSYFFKIKLKKKYFLWLLCIIPLYSFYPLSENINHNSNLPIIYTAIFFLLFNLILLITIETALNESKEQENLVMQ